MSLPVASGQFHIHMGKGHGLEMDLQTLNKFQFYTKLEEEKPNSKKKTKPNNNIYKQIDKNICSLGV